VIASRLYGEMREYLGVVDAADGKLLHTHILPKSIDRNFVATMPIQLIGQSLVKYRWGQVFDLKNMEYLFQYDKFEAYLKLSFDKFTFSDGPWDGRSWYVTEHNKNFGEMVGPKKKTSTFLTARKLPYTYDIELPPAEFSQMPWAEGTSLRVESCGNGSAEYHQKVVDLISKELTQAGHAIDPNSKNIVRLTTGDSQRVEGANADKPLFERGGQGRTPTGKTRRGTLTINNPYATEVMGLIQFRPATGKTFEMPLTGRAEWPGVDEARDSLRSAGVKVVSDAARALKASTHPRGYKQQLPIGIDGLVEPRRQN
jgi:hypothetical protein